MTSYYGNNPEYGFTVAQPLLRDLYPSGRRNDERNRGFFTFDARAAREFQRPFGRTWGLVLEGFNLLNDDTLQILEIRDGVAYATRRFGRRLQVGLRAAF